MGRKTLRAGDAKRAIAYLRVSTDRQEHGPEAQRAVLTEWAALNGVQITDWIAEEESGAATIDERPELQRAFEALRTHGAGVFLAAKRDRIAREVTIARDIAARVRELGAVVVTADGMSDTENRPDGFLRQGISDLFAEHERREIADRTRRGLAAMKAKGLRTGQAPYGYQTAKDGPLSKKSGRPLRLVPHPGEQAVCATVMRLHARGVRVPEIEDELIVQGVKSRRGHRLEQKQVRKIIASCERLRELFPDHAGGAALRAPTHAACARGHTYDASTLGKYCVKDACREGRGDRDPMRRIEWR